MRRKDADRERRMHWFRDARFGMFIHWGLYAVPGGIWKGRDIGGVGEWIQTSAQIPPAEYEPLQQQFNPVRFNAREWVAIAKNAGMKYLVITSKHHDGFCLWDSKLTDWDIMGTPYRRDILKELARECRKQGVRLCFYHSIMDWHHPDYLPRRPWDKRPVDPASFPRYIAYMKGQLKELIQNYGPLGILWFDGEWENTWTHEMGKELYAYVRSLQPDIIINNRIDKGRQGMAGDTAKGDYAGDYGTPEQEIPANGFGEAVDWESCMTLNDTWGFKFKDEHWKSTETLLQNLIDCASKGGNYLLNVGPTPEGTFPLAITARLKEMGQWLRLNGEAIYGTSASPFPKPLPWGRVTRKGNRLYLHVFDSRAESIFLPGLKTPVISVQTLLVHTAEPVFKRRTDNTRIVTATIGRNRLRLTPMARPEGVTIPLPPEVRGQQIPVLVVELAGPPVIESVALGPQSDGTLLLAASEASVHGGTARYEADKRCIGYWTEAGDTVSWEAQLPAGGAFAVEVEHACADDSAGTEFEVEVRGARPVRGQVRGTGGWDRFVTGALGNVVLPAGGKVTITVTPRRKPGLAVMNLRSVRLRPVAPPAQEGYTDTPYLPGNQWRVHDKLRPRPPVVTPPPSDGKPVPAPPDALVLFDGRDTSAWTKAWKVEDGAMVVTPGMGDNQTKQAFTDCHLHVEFATPAEVRGNGQGRGNSGVFLMGRYEIQVLDSYQNETYADGQCAAVYGQYPPLVNACRKPGEWQTYDIYFLAPRFDGEKLVRPARVTVIQNGIVVQNGVEPLGPMAHRALSHYTAHGPGPIQFQDHGNPVRYRNIWIRPLKGEE